MFILFFDCRSSHLSYCLIFVILLELLPYFLRKEHQSKILKTKYQKKLQSNCRLVIECIKKINGWSLFPSSLMFIQIFFLIGPRLGCFLFIFIFYIISYHIIFLKSTNFRGDLISRVEKKYILRLLIFAKDRLRKYLRVLILVNLDFFLLGLVQSGLEVPCEVTVRRIGSDVNHLLLTWYEKLLNELYVEPKNEEIVETFLSVADEEGNKQRQICGNKKETGERSEIKEHSGYVAKPKIRKGWR